MSRKSRIGNGCSIPPDKRHVEIYFIAQGSTAIEALRFFAEYSSKNWLNTKGFPISNWKQHAWRYIWY